MGTKGNNYAYIDGANLHKGIQELGWQISYRKFRVFLKDKYSVEKVYLFLGFMAQNSSMYRNLQTAGYILVFKPTVLNPDGEVKGNCDAELVLQAMIDFQSYQMAVIVTGDGDFACLVSHLQKEGKLEQVISPNHKKCSVLLKRLVPNQHLFLDRFKDRLEWK